MWASFPVATRASSEGIPTEATLFVASIVRIIATASNPRWIAFVADSFLWYTMLRADLPVAFRTNAKCVPHVIGTTFCIAFGNPPFPLWHHGRTTVLLRDSRDR